MTIKRCLGCMQTYDDIDEMCPHCGYIDGTPAKEAYHIKPGSLLHDRYTIGRAVGFGGFGITYVAWDNKLMQKVAIKEYMPSEYATRVPGSMTVTIFDGERHAEFMSGLQKFLDEAQRLAKFQDVHGIVRILDSFSENLTAYIVMEFLEGKTLKQHLEECGGKIPYEDSVEVILPVLAALSVVHKEGIIHRDISPDNIFLTDSGDVKLLDFGAARYASTGYSKSLSVILKPGYAPAEQYLSHGEQGAWSDVYATAATLYRMITGVVPDEALERKEKDTLKAPSALGVKLSKNAETAILNALNVRVENRTPSADAFEEQLLSTVDVIRVKEKGDRKFSAKMSPWLRVTIIAAAVLLCAGIALFTTGTLKLGLGHRLAFDSDLFADGDVNTPGVINLTEQEGSEAAQKQSLVFYVTGAFESSKVAKGIIMSQTPDAGTKVPAGTRLAVEISTGPQYALVPDIVDTLWERTKAKITSAGFIPKVFYEYSDLVPEGAVISLGHDAGENFQIGEKLKVVVSSGPEKPLPQNPTTMPEISGTNFAEAKALLNKHGLRVIRENDRYDMSVPKGEVITQSVASGSSLTTGDIIYVSISMGVEQTNVPNVQYLDQANAIAALKNAKLTYSIKEEESDTVREGLVIRQGVEAGTIVDVQTTIPIVISLGKRADMPNMVGRNIDAARSELATLGFMNVTFEEEYSDTVAEELVISQNIPTGNRISVEENVHIVFSGKRAEVPNAVGKDVNSVRSELNSRGFENVSYSSEYSENVEENAVISQSISAGQRVNVAEYIEIVYSLGKMPVNITLDANGGRVSSSNYTVYYPDTYGSLPTPTRECYTFLGWRSNSTGSRVTGSSNVPETEHETLIAEWRENPLSGWTLASNLPSNAVVVNRKYTYDVTEYTTSTSSSMSGWTMYDQKRELSDYGAWSDWTTSYIASSDMRKVDTKTEYTEVLTGYNMVEYTTRRNGVRQYRSYSINGNYSGYGLESGYGEHHNTASFTVDQVNAATRVSAGSSISGSGAGVNKDSKTGYALPYGNQTVVFFISSEKYSTTSTTYYRYSDRYEVMTYYFKRTVSAESASYPSGSNISNIVEYVQYRQK